MLSHELAHVALHAQQPVIHCDNGGGAVPAPEPLSRLHNRLDLALTFQQGADALALAQSMAPRLTTDADLTSFGIDVIAALITGNRRRGRGFAAAF